MKRFEINLPYLKAVFTDTIENGSLNLTNLPSIVLSLTSASGLVKSAYGYMQVADNNIADYDEDVVAKAIGREVSQKVIDVNFFGDHLDNILIAPSDYVRHHSRENVRGFGEPTKSPEEDAVKIREDYLSSIGYAIARSHVVKKTPEPKWTMTVNTGHHMAKDRQDFMYASIDAHIDGYRVTLNMASAEKAGPEEKASEQFGYDCSPMGARPRRSALHGGYMESTHFYFDAVRGSKTVTIGVTLNGPGLEKDMFDLTALEHILSEQIDKKFAELLADLGVQQGANRGYY